MQSFLCITPIIHQDPNNLIISPYPTLVGKPDKPCDLHNALAWVIYGKYGEY